MLIYSSASESANFITIIITMIDIIIIIIITKDWNVSSGGEHKDKV